MKRVFADSGYWIALLLRGDQLHERAKALSKSLGEHRIYTSELVLTEVLNFLADKGWYLREAAARIVEEIQHNPNIEVEPLTSIQFEQALRLYRNRKDKAWSLTDCDSFKIMERHGLSEALAHDEHFEQAGFQALLRPDSW